MWTEYTKQLLAHERQSPLSFHGYLEEVSVSTVRGWCFSPDVPGPRSIVVKTNKKEISHGLASLFRLDLLEAGIGNGCHGFSINIDNALSYDDVEVYPVGSETPLARIADFYRSAQILPRYELIQTFAPEKNYLSSISLCLALDGRKQSSSLSFALFKLDKSNPSSSNMSLIFEKSENADAVDDRQYMDIMFPPENCSQDEIFVLKVASMEATSDDSVAALLHAGSSRIRGHLSCTVGGSDQRDFGIVAKTGYSPPEAETIVPHRILYSPVTQCNLNCVHCISRDTRDHVSRISDDLRGQIKSWCERGLIRQIHTDYSGDILWADDRWGGELDFLIGLDVPFHIDTNGAYLTKERGHKLLTSSKLTSLNVSLDAAKPETYKRIRKGSKPLDAVVENIAEFAELRRAAGQEERVTLSLGFTLMRSNIDELCDFIEIGARLGVDRVECRHVEAYTGDMVSESLWLHKEYFNEVRAAAVKLAAERGVILGIDQPLKERPTYAGHRFCTQPWDAAVILGNGDVQVCCLPKTKIGNLQEQTMEELWNGAAYAAFRLSVNSDTPPAACNACAYMRRPGNQQSYLPFLTINDWQSPHDLWGK